MSRFSELAFQDRLSFAIGQAMTRHRFGNQIALAQRLTVVSGIPIKQAAVSRWTSGSRPAFEHLVVLADLAAVDPGWLAMGPLSKAPGPDAYIPFSEPETAKERVTPIVVKKKTPAPKGAPAISARKSGRRA